MKFPAAVLTLTLLLQVSTASAAQETAGHDHAAGAHSGEHLGTVSFPNSGKPAAQTSFLRGLALLHSFEYEDAADAFREAQRADHGFAIAYWGEALTYAKLVWGLDYPDSARAALARLAPTPEARLKLAATDRERAYGEAVEALYQNADLATRTRGYVARLRSLTSLYPQDLEARAFLAIALQMNAGYNREETRQLTLEAITLAESIFQAQPDHPGGAHYLIHATDNPELAPRGVAAARAYAKIAPDAEHALHMPSHIFVQIGAWDDVVSSNERAWAASRAWVKNRGVPNSELSFHVLSWLQYGYLQQGRYAAARALLDTAVAVLRDVDFSKDDAIDARYATDLLRFTYATETGDWSSYGGKPPRLVSPSASTSSRSRFFAQQGAYRTAFTAGVVRDTVTANGFLASFAGPGAMSEIARAHVASLDARARGDVEAYVASLRDAATADAKIVHSGPPSVVPAHELLGEALLNAGRYNEAIQAFNKSLELMPNRSKSLLGLARAYWSAGKRDSARVNYAKLRANWHSADAAVRSLTELVGAQSAVGMFDSQMDVGRPGRPGSASYEPQRQEYLLAGSGQNMWSDRDEFHFVWKRLTGNFILSTRARFVGAGVEAHRKIGWTIRPSLETNSAHVTAALHGDGLMSLQFRRTTGGITEEAKSRDSLPDPDAVVQLERRDGIYVMSVARFGDTLVTQELAGVSLPDTVYVGLFVCAHNDTVVERAGFTNVRITTPAKRDFVPYRDYIGSNLEILDVATGKATIVHQYHGSFQAPNWTRDGKALIYAQEGRLYRFDLATRSAGVINTGFATRNNNDHVLSFDGRMMAISNHAPEDSGASIVYTVPTTGGTPKRITAKGPSYLHGWSPDGRWLVYVGQRNDEFDVYKIPAGGGKEIRLTSSPGLDDGPEYTPDGKYIYFNSVRSGRMQIWHMRPDGSRQEQITNDGFNNWFPHISPNGKWIAYISFPPDVAADDHPFYKHVLIRLMPIGGGPARVIAYVYGGQGTINVPSWSPDGTRLAFVSNSVLP